MPLTPFAILKMTWTGQTSIQLPLRPDNVPVGPVVAHQRKTQEDATRETYSAGPNPQQLTAIHATKGPVLIIAGPGSGKTYTLVERIAHLIEEEDAIPGALFVVTFTEKAARELAARISNRLATSSPEFDQSEMHLGTFHSVCLRLLKEYSEYTEISRDCTQLDQFDQQYFLYLRLKEFDTIPDVHLVTGKGRPWQRSEALAKRLNQICEEAVDIDGLEQANRPELRALARCFQHYQDSLKDANSLDFSNIQLKMLELLKQHPKVLTELQQKFSHLMVDEYQDTNTIQEKIIKLLAAEHENLCVVGDDDQSLYRFRGATVRNILNFPKMFGDTEYTKVALETNYRSHRDIIDFCSLWMNRSEWVDGDRSFRHEKKLKANGDSFPETSAVVRLSGASGEGRTWHTEILRFLRALKSSGKLEDWNQVAFLFHSVKNPRVVALAHYLESQNIPVYSPRSNMFFEREEIRLMIGALIFLFPQFRKIRKWEVGATMDIWDYYDKKCLKAFEDELRKPENAVLRTWAKERSQRHSSLTKDTSYSFLGLFYQLLEFPLFAHYLDEKETHGVDNGRSARNLAIFSQLLDKCEIFHRIKVITPKYLERNLRNLFNQFLHFLYDGGINEYEGDADYAPKGCVSFMTIHQAKGLEFPIVVCGSMEASPRAQPSLLDKLLEEEGLLQQRDEPSDKIKFFDFWRLFYTAFSRAQNLLVLAAREHQGRDRIAPSKYFEGFFNPLPDWKILDLDSMSFASVREIDLKRTYSFTADVAMFENCAEQYRVFKELGFRPRRTAPMLFGMVVHKTIEDIHRAVLRGEEDIITPDKIQDWFSINYERLSETMGTFLAPPAQKDALNQVLQYCERQNGAWGHIREAEFEVSLDKGQYILTGSVDLVVVRGDTMEIVDFKTSEKLDSAQLAQHQRQLEFYVHLMEKHTGQKVSRVHIYYTGRKDGSPMVSFERGDLAIPETLAHVDKIVQRIKNQDFWMTKRPTHLCPDCDLEGYCDSKEREAEAGQ